MSVALHARVFPQPLAGSQSFERTVNNMRELPHNNSSTKTSTNVPFLLLRERHPPVFNKQIPHWKGLANEHGCQKLLFLHIGHVHVCGSVYGVGCRHSLLFQRFYAIVVYRSDVISRQSVKAINGATLSQLH